MIRSLAIWSQSESALFVARYGKLRRRAHIGIKPKRKLRLFSQNNQNTAEGALTLQKTAEKPRLAEEGAARSQDSPRKFDALQDRLRRKRRFFSPLLGQGIPEDARPQKAEPRKGEIIALPGLNGLHRDYQHAA